MFDSINISDNISFLIVFLEGILSFFSPCILPLIPVYMTYLAGNTLKTLPDGNIEYDKKKTFLHTIFFILGVSVTFFLLGMSFSLIGTFFSEYQATLTRIGGILIIILGLFQLGVFEFKFLKKNKNIAFDMTGKKVNPLVAFVMGFTFSFAWTPCVGPALSSVLILASSAKDAFTGNLLIGVYALGFLIPFLLLGIFTASVLNFFKKYKKVVNYTVKISGVLLVILGIMTFTGMMNGVSRYLNSISPNSAISEQNTTENITEQIEDETEQASQEATEGNAEDEDTIDAFDFTLQDQYGNTHTLSDYKGKVVFLNFWATWCNPCLIEMPYIEEIYKEYGLNEDEVVILGIANPASAEYPNNSDIPKDEIMQFIDEKGYTFPILFDETREVFDNYQINAFPTTFMIDKNGKIYGYLQGSITKELMQNIVNETLESTEK